VPVGDQQASLLGERCIDAGAAKCTYGTGSFLLYNTGAQLVHSKMGLLTTVAYQLGPDAPVVYALEGSGSIGGTAVRWLRDQLGIISVGRFIRHARTYWVCLGHCRCRTLGETSGGHERLRVCTMFHWAVHTSMGCVGTCNYLRYGR
jgi:hypothetical protein